MGWLAGWCLMCECLTCTVRTHYPSTQPVCAAGSGSGPVSPPGPGAGAGAGVWWPLPPLHSDTRHQPPAPFSYSDLARRFASPTVKPSISFSLVPSHRILHSHPPRSLLLPSPISVHQPLLPPSTLTCLPQRNPLTSTSINLDHGQIDFCVVQVRDSGARKQLISRHRHRLFLFCGLFIQSFSSQDRVNEATAVGRKQPKANCQLHPPPQSSRVQPSPAQRLVG